VQLEAYWQGDPYGDCLLSTTGGLAEPGPDAHDGSPFQVLASRRLVHLHGADFYVRENLEPEGDNAFDPFAAGRFRIAGCGLIRAEGAGERGDALAGCIGETLTGARASAARARDLRGREQQAAGPGRGRDGQGGAGD